jgi:hypothetical protein
MPPPTWRLHALSYPANVRCKAPLYRQIPISSRPQGLKAGETACLSYGCLE